MRPYYQDDYVTLYHGDFRQAPIGELADCAVVDPPYEETRLWWDVWPRGWPAEIGARMKPAASLWCWGSLRLVLKYQAEFAGWRYVQDVVWEKHNGTSLAADRFRRVHELVVQYVAAGVPWSMVHAEPVRRVVNDRRRGHVVRCSKPKHWGDVSTEKNLYVFNGTRLARSVIFERSAHGRAKHSTQKPLGLTKDLVAYSCPRGGVVLDIFAGSGTTLVAAKELGRRAVGFEICEKHCAAAVERLRAACPPAPSLAHQVH